MGGGGHLDNTLFWLGFIIFFVILLIIFIFKYGVQPGISVSASLTSKEIKDYFLKKYYCKECKTRLKRESQKAFKGKGWSESMESIYGEKYEITYRLKCPTCNRVYTSDDV
ncbi:hypothetical protein PAENIP36_30070 [Paenibacillus sp. P36]